MQLATHASVCRPPSDGTQHDDASLAALLATHTYAQVQDLTGLSKGTIYRAALRTGARKTEARIAVRATERRQQQLAFLQEMLDTTATADVLDFLAGLPDDSVQCHMTSPPYNLGKKYGAAPGADALRMTYFHGWMMQVIGELARTVRPGGVVCLNVGKTPVEQGTLYPMDVLLFEDMRRAGLTFQNRVVWTHPHGLTPSRRLADRYETILIFCKGREPTFNPNAARQPQKQPGKRSYKGPSKGELSCHPLGAWPTDVWSDIPSVRANHPDRALGAHPAQFPVRLAKRVILLYSLPGDLICDVFVGSGSTVVAAIEAGRAFVGADLFYEDLRAARVAAATADTITPLEGVTDESLAVWQADARKVQRCALTMAPAAEVAQCADLFGEVWSANQHDL